MPIRVLPPEVAARIAAGEGVERPASVVKELVENALDAAASRIFVEVTVGGLDSVRVTDDGCGIEAAEIEAAFQRHATSKLADDADLARVLTLGFRGEALPSIAAVAEVEMVSRPAGTDSGAKLRLLPEAPPEISTCGAPVGTSTTVRRLFARLPARRKFLRSAASETNAVTAVVSHYALAYPEVRFTLTFDGRQVLQTPGSGDPRDALAAVYGTEAAAAMLEVGGKERRPRNTQAVDGILVNGLVGPPHISRAGRQYISLFVNRRWIQNRRLAFAVEEAYPQSSARSSGRCAQRCSTARPYATRQASQVRRRSCCPRRLRRRCSGSTACASPPGRLPMRPPAGWLPTAKRQASPLRRCRHCL